MTQVGLGWGTGSKTLRKARGQLLQGARVLAVGPGVDLNGCVKKGGWVVGATH